MTEGAAGGCKVQCVAQREDVDILRYALRWPNGIGIEETKGWA